ncbi:C40 family peptidase [Nocardioides iriomotensis]|uniref:NlpC/P60 family protein n=1 Tax=Nocardioides iriomotensis TaxID=715784 RepID=A0A4Q5IZ96_9ACTN|nr:C40 family peptidase [Nocardioides iriomotensis]RYU11530.1 NlpC/P60 family protein [Nocardioides iriomotensis]
MPITPARPRAVRSVLLTIATAVAVAVTGLSAAPSIADEPASTRASHSDSRAGTDSHHRKHYHKHHHKQHRAKRHHRAKHAGGAAIRAFRVAAAQKGDPYRYGAAGPNAFDCSGLTSYAFRRAGVPIPRTSSAQRGATRPIPARAARPGDLVFFQSGGSVYHVGFYAGHHQVLHSPYSGTRVRKERIWTSAVSYGRVR